MKTHNHREWLTHPEWWSNTLMCPLVRHRRSISAKEVERMTGNRIWQYSFLGDKQSAIMLPRQASVYPVYVGVMGITNFAGSDVPTFFYPTIDALLADGWEVD